MANAVLAVVNNSTKIIQMSIKIQYSILINQNML